MRKNAHSFLFVSVAVFFILQSNIETTWGGEEAYEVPSDLQTPSVDFDGDHKVSKWEVFCYDLWMKDPQLSKVLLEAERQGDYLPSGITDISSYLSSLQTKTTMTTGVGCDYSCICCFIRGDVNRDESLDISDLNVLGDYVYSGVLLANMDAGDVNDDGAVDISDISYLSSYLYSGGEEPPAPFPDSGTDPTYDLIELPCSDRGDFEHDRNSMEEAEIVLPPQEDPGFPDAMLPSSPIEPIDGTGGFGWIAPQLPVFPGPGGFGWGFQPSYRTRYTVRGSEAVTFNLETEVGINWFTGIPHIISSEDGSYWVRWSASCVRKYTETGTPHEFEGRFQNMTKLIYDDASNEFVLYDLSGKSYVFYGYGPDAEAVKGRIKQINGLGGAHIDFNWDLPGGYLEFVDILSPAGSSNPCQTWFFEYNADDRFVAVWLERPSGESPFEINCRYHDGAVEEGTLGDLMQIDVINTLSSADYSVTKSYYYRYYQGSFDPGQGQYGYAHQLHYMFSPDSCAQLDAQIYQTLPIDDLTVAPDRTYRYCEDRRLKSLALKGRCCGAGGGTYQYVWYLGIRQSAASDWANNHIKAEIELPHEGGVDNVRRVVCFNTYGQELLDAKAVLETGQPEKVWATKADYNSVGDTDCWCIYGMYSPAACSSVNIDAGSECQLDCEMCGESPAFTGVTDLFNSYTTSGTGRHVEYAYTLQPPVYTLGVNVGEGDGPTQPKEYFQKSLMTDSYRMRWLLEETGQYESESNCNATTYTYHSFYGTGIDPLSFHKVEKTYPTVTTARNGPDSSVSALFWYDRYGMLVWSKDAKNSVTYREYDTNAGVCDATWLLTVVVDEINTTSPPPGINTGTPPEDCYTDNGINHLSEFVYDASGRRITAREPGGLDDTNNERVRVRRVRYEKLTGPTGKLSADKPVTLSFQHVAGGSLTGEVSITGQTPGGKPCISASAFMQDPVTSWDNTAQNLEDAVTEGVLLERGETEHLYDTDGNYYILKKKWTDPESSSCNSLYTEERYYDSRGLLECEIGAAIIDGADEIRDTVRYEHDPLNRLKGVYKGITRDGGDTIEDEIVVNHIYYDGGETASGTELAVGDGNVTCVESFRGDGQAESEMSKRVTKFLYNWKGQLERIGQDFELGMPKIIKKVAYDYVGRKELVEIYGITDFDGELPQDKRRSKREYKYDEMGRIYETVSYGINPEDGTECSEKHLTRFWYSAVGKVIKQENPDGTFNKYAYDNLERQTKEYLCFDLDESGYPAAGTVAGDTVVEKTEDIYDKAGSALITKTFARFNDASGEGELYPGDNISRVSYRCRWYDIFGRVTVDADYGDNGGVDIDTRPDSVPQETSSNALVTCYDYCKLQSELTSAGQRWSYAKSIKGVISGSTIDALGRTVRSWTREKRSIQDAAQYKIEDYTFDAVGNMVTKTVYKGQLAATTELPPEGTPTGFSTTAFDYGVIRNYANGSWSENLISSTSLLKAVRRPDPSGGSAGEPCASEAFKFAYNALGEARAIWWNKKMSGAGDDVFVGRQIQYDGLGRRVSDKVAQDDGNTPGMTELSWEYNALGDIVSAKSSANGVVQNEVQIDYGPWGEVSRIFQEHDGEVDIVMDQGEETIRTPYAKCFYEGPGTQGGHPIRRRREYQCIYKKTEDGNNTEAVINIEYDYGADGEISDMLTRPALYKYKRYPMQDCGVYKTKEYFMGRSRWVKSEYQKQKLQDPTQYITTLVQKIPNYTYHSNEQGHGLDRFGRPVEYKAARYDEEEGYYAGFPVRKTWSYYSTTASVDSEKCYRQQTPDHDEIETVIKEHVYDSYVALADLNLQYRQYPIDDYPLEENNQYWTYDGVNNWVCYSEDDPDSNCDCGQGDTTREYDGRCEVLEIMDISNPIRHNEVGSVKEYYYQPHGVTNKEFFYDAWRRLVKYKDEIEGMVSLFEYDALGHLIVHYEYQSSEPPLNVPMNYYYDIDWNRVYWYRDVPDDSLDDFERAEFTSSFSGRPLGIQDGDSMPPPDNPQGGPEPLEFSLIDPIDQLCGLANADGTLHTLVFTKTPNGEPVAQAAWPSSWPEDPIPYEDAWWEAPIIGFVKGGGGVLFCELAEQSDELYGPPLPSDYVPPPPAVEELRQKAQEDYLRKQLHEYVERAKERAKERAERAKKPCERQRTRKVCRAYSYRTSAFGGGATSVLKLFLRFIRNSNSDDCSGYSCRGAVKKVRVYDPGGHVRSIKIHPRACKPDITKFMVTNLKIDGAEGGMVFDTFHIRIQGWLRCSCFLGSPPAIGRTSGIITGEKFLNPERALGMSVPEVGIGMLHNIGSSVNDLLEQAKGSKKGLAGAITATAEALLRTIKAIKRGKESARWHKMFDLLDKVFQNKPLSCF